jgi:hypothetical protein
MIFTPASVTSKHDDRRESCTPCTVVGDPGAKRLIVAVDDDTSEPWPIIVLGFDLGCDHGGAWPHDQRGRQCSPTPRWHDTGAAP